MTNEKELPEWTDCQSMFASGQTTALSEFIREFEPVDPEREAWRASFGAALATVRREETEAAIDAVGACSTRDELHPDISITVSEFKERVIGLLKAGLTEK